MNKVIDIDGNEVAMNDQGEVLDASHSQSEPSVTETQRSPGTPEKAETASPVEDWKAKYETSQKDYERLNKEFTRRSQRNSELEKSLQQYEPYKENLPRWKQADEILRNNPAAYKYLEAQLQGYSHEAAQSYAEQGQNQQSNRYIEELTQKTAQHDAFIKQFQQAQGQQQAASHLDTQERAANDVYKTYFGKDMSESDKHALYSFMTENNFFNGEKAVKAIFAEQYAEARAQKILEDQKTKGSKMIQRTPTKNSAAAKSPTGKNMSLREALEVSLAEFRGQDQ